MSPTLESLLESVLRVSVGTLSVAVAFPDRATFAAKARQGRSIPGFPFASVGRTATGPQLFIHRTMLPAAKLGSLDAGAIWQAAYRAPVPPGYKALVIPDDPMARFRILSIVAVLSPILPTVEQKMREVTAHHPGGLNAQPAETPRFADGSVRFAPLS